jgi:hypothetical protein
MAHGVKTPDAVCQIVVRMIKDNVDWHKVFQYTNVPRRTQQEIWKQFRHTGDGKVPVLNTRAPASIDNRRGLGVC